jgi:IS5 family transposase
MSYRTFTRLPEGLSPSGSGLQSTIRSIRPETLEKVYDVLSIKWIEEGKMSLEKSRIGSTVVKSHITPSSDSQLLNSSVRVLSLFFAKSQSNTSVKIRFTDKREASRGMGLIYGLKRAVTFNKSSNI